MCIDTYEFLDIFPSWATRSDIEKSLGYPLYNWGGYSPIIPFPVILDDEEFPEELLKDDVANKTEVLEDSEDADSEGG